MLASEAYVMFTANRTHEWLQSKNSTEQADLIQNAMSMSMSVRRNS